MTFVWPWIFLVLAPVAAAALLALFRPRRNLVVAGSLSLWTEAINSASASSLRKTRRTSLAWWLLLVGAVLAVGAGSRPVYYSSSPARSVAIVLHPSAELGREGLAEMRQAGQRLCERLAAADRVQLLLPEILGGEGRWISPAEAHQLLAELSQLPVSAVQLPTAEAHHDAQHVYHLAPASLEITTGPDVSRIDIPAHLPGVTIDALGAERTDSGKLQVFAALRNDGQQPVSARLTVTDALAPERLSGVVNVTIRPGSRQSVTTTVEPADALAVSVGEAGAYLVRVATTTRAVAIVGKDDPYLRRLIEVDRMLKLVTDPDAAEIVIANGLPAPPGKPALVIAPPQPPAPWRSAERETSSIMLSEADVTGDDPLMRGVDLSAAAIRRVRAWVRGDVPAGGVLIGYKGSVLAVRTADDADASQPRRVYLAFDLSENNCTLVRTDAYVVFLANVMRYLAPGGTSVERYEYRTPLQAGVNPAWKPIVRDEKFDAGVLQTAGLTAPGVFRDAGGRLHAVSLVGLRSTGVSTPPARAVAAATLPEGRPLTRGVELWSILLAAAGAFWLAGWSAAAIRD
ncbi:MAG: hypothetical protein QGG42_20365 [Phycisphaerae bacterium]|jgi:hypothetical protein|nr:hypothetical protein [Phycisphaerae bacterium]